MHLRSNVGVKRYDLTDFEGLMHLYALQHFENYLDWPERELRWLFAHLLKLKVGHCKFRSTRWHIYQ